LGSSSTLTTGDSRMPAQRYVALWIVSAPPLPAWMSASAGSA